MSTEPSTSLVRGIGWCLDFEAGTVLVGETTTRLEPKALAVARLLLSRPGEVVSKEELFRVVWEGRAVSDDVLTVAVHALRKALGDDARSPRFIETVARRGYRWVAPLGAGIAEPGPRPIVAQRISNPWRLRAAVLAGLLSAAALAAWWLRPPPRIQTLMVLPYADLSPEAPDPALAAGLTQALTTALARLGTVEVVSLADAPRSAISGTEPRRRLEPDAWVEGSVTRQGGRVRVTTSLVRGDNRRYLWSEVHERPGSDRLELERELSLTLARALQLALLEQGGRRAPRPVPEAARELFERAATLEPLPADGSLDQAIEVYQRALALAPDYAAAYAALADTYVSLAQLGRREPRDLYRAARAAASRAVELDPHLALAHRALGEVELALEWNSVAAEASFRHALALAPDEPRVHRSLAWLLLSWARFPEAMAHAHRALELGGQDTRTRIDVASVFGMVGEPERGAALLASTALSPDVPPELFFTLGWLESLASRPGRAWHAYRGGLARLGLGEGDLRHLDRQFEAEGLAKILRIWLGLVDGNPSGMAWTHHWKAQLQAQLGEKAAALAELERAFEQREAMMAWTGVHPDLKSLQGEPRFVDLVRRVRLASFRGAAP